MKNFILLFTFLFSVVGTAQEVDTLNLQVQEGFNPWTIEAELGTHGIADKSAVLTDKWNHLGLNVRYNFTPTVGLGIYSGYDNLTLQQFGGDIVETDFKTLNLEGVIDIFDVLKLNTLTDDFTMLLHGGPGLARIVSRDYSENIFTTSLGVSALVRLNKNLSLKGDFTATGNYMHEKTLDGFDVTTSAGLNSYVTNLSLGLTYALPFGKRGDLTPADYYVEKQPEYITPEILDTWVTNIIEQVKDLPVKPNIINNTIINSCDCKVQEFVFFDHDKYFVRQSELNAIAQVVEYMLENEEAEVEVIGYASNTSSSDDYNLALSTKRVQAVTMYLRALGVDGSRIVETSKGKDLNKDEAIHDTARRVELLIKK